MTITFKKIHKVSGIFAGAVLLLLAVTGFFINRDSWNFLYTVKAPNSFIPERVIAEGNRLNEVFLIDKEEEDLVISAGQRGVFVSNDKGKKYMKTLSLRCYSIRQDTTTSRYYAATSDGIYLSTDKGNTWEPFALRSKIVNALSLHNDKLFASINKSVVALINNKGEVLLETPVHIPANQLKEKISLSRFVRDLHYGRGLFDNGWSLLINDVSALFLFFLAISGYLIWYFIKQIKYKKNNRSKQVKLFMKLHSSIMSLIIVIPLVLLTLTGIALDHSDYFSSFLRSTSISSSHLPPVYHFKSEPVYFNFRKPDVPLPKLQTTTLYTILSALHNGKFFASWWTYVNDGAAFFLFMLFTSGTVRWFRKDRKII